MVKSKVVLADKAFLNEGRVSLQHLKLGVKVKVWVFTTPGNLFQMRRGQVSTVTPDLQTETSVSAFL